MIHVNRASVPVPTVLQERAADALKKLAAFYREDRKARSQRRTSVDGELLGHPEIRETLWRLFDRKCAYCESAMSRMQQMYVDAFRPNSHAAQMDGTVSPDHYWGLTYDWRNLYGICGSCFSQKGPRFPVNGARGAADSTSPQEMALLLDPCRDDEDPEKHLSFKSDGTVEGLTEKGRVTIDVLGLNRLTLVQARREACDGFDSVGDQFLSGEDPRRWELPGFLSACLEEHAKPVPFVALARQQLTRYFERAQSDARPFAGAKQFTFKRLPTRESYEGAVWIERIEIENFKAIEKLNIAFPSMDTARSEVNFETDEQQPWLVLLGENAVGKSSLLKAVALALAPGAMRSRLVSHAGELVTRKSKKPEGMIRISFNVGAMPLELHFSRKSRHFGVSSEAPAMSMLGYGSTRLLPPQSRKRTMGRAAPRRERIRIANLFDPRANLMDGERWLADTRSTKPAVFDLLMSGLRELLPLDDKDTIRRRNQRLIARLAGQSVGIRELSDGYQSIMALALDMMTNLSTTTFDTKGMEGIVLIDELEVHLHPQWKKEVVAALRKIFPRVRFIVTTHDPLCVQGLKNGELHILGRDDDTQKIAARQIDVPPGLRADEILTGTWFKLETTRDPATLQLMKKHGDLLLVQNRTPQQEAQLQELRTTIRDRIGRFADSPYERAALRAYAELAPRASDLSPEEQQARLQRRIRELLPLSQT